MNSVLALGRTIFLQLESSALLALVLGSRIIASFAGRTFQPYDLSWHINS
jgi:hypothetical protein